MACGCWTRALVRWGEKGEGRKNDTGRKRSSVSRRSSEGGARCAANDCSRTMDWTAVIILLMCSGAQVCDAQRRTRALYPSAFRVKRGIPSMVNPIFQNSIDDVNLLFEILLAGTQMEDEHSPFSVQDEELNSLRRIQKLQVICDEVIPRKLTDIRRLTSELLRHPGILHREDFERTVLTFVYTAHRMLNTAGHQKDVWTESFLNLYEAIKQDITTA
ncbi:protein FAM180A-like [Scleropages formosus]|uniref:protein FAM180A-like n=1 Tax=Scleropages formosus TaxID=113540 RepID=UPI0010FA73E5|nr:protein FAM180A-like [Scleropages formosus]